MVVIEIMIKWKESVNIKNYLNIFKKGQYFFKNGDVFGGNLI